MAVDENGLTIKTLEEILADIEARQRADIDPAIITEPEEPLGQINGIYADSERQAWEALQEAYDAFDPDNAEGAALDHICALSGTVRLKPQYSKVTCQVDLDDGTALISGTHFAHVTGAPDRRFTPVANYTAVGSGVKNVVFRAENLGPVVANAGTLTVIATPLSGWNSVTNGLDAKLGTDEETDAALRARREQRLQAAGSGTVGAIKSGIFGINDATGEQQILSVKIFENATDVYVNGVPPHAFEALVFDGETPQAADNDIAQAIFDNQPAGIPAVGNASGTATDKDGVTHVVAFSRPTVRPVYITIEPVGSPDATLLKAAIVTRMRSDNDSGKDVIINEINAAAMDHDDVTDIVSTKAGFAPAPAGTVNLAIADREVAAYDTSRVTVV
jgi:uncharacterized phage protein gp47/JayE